MSTYSTNLRLELIGTGEQPGAWGNTTNTNLGTLLEQAISGYVTQAITDGADTVISIPDGANGVARNMFIECTGTLTAARNLVVPANKKLYFIFNNTSGGFAVTVKVSGQTGVSVPNGKKMLLVCNGTDIVVATNHMIGTLDGDVSGNAGTVTNGVYTTGAQTIGGAKTFNSNITTTAVVATGLGSTSGQYTAVAGASSTWYGAFLRNDGSSVYMLSSSVQTTAAAAATAAFNSFRPFSWSLATGAVTIAGSGESTNVGGALNVTGVITGPTAGASSPVGSFVANTTGGSYAGGYTRYGPFKSSVTHIGSSFAPTVSMFYTYSAGGGYAGVYHMGHLATNGANPGNLVIQHINQSDTAQNTWSFDGANGNFTATGNVAAYSDERVKTDWAALPDTFIYDLARVKHGTYTRIDTGERQAGASAQDMQNLLAEVVHTNADEMLSLAYGNAALVAAIKLAQKVVELEARLAKLGG